MKNIIGIETMQVDYIPDQYYVGVKDTKSKSTTKLAFMTPITHDSAFKLRKETVHGWCGDDKDNTFIEVSNRPMCGFVIDTNNRRVSTENVVWKMTHPYGYNFEITSENMCEIVNNSTIIKGVINRKLMFVRRGNENYLTWPGSEIHNGAKSIADLEKRVSVKDLTIGDEVQFKNLETGIYRGSFHVLSIPTTTICGRLWLIRHDPERKSKRKHLFTMTKYASLKKVESDIVVAVSTPILKIMGNHGGDIKANLAKLRNGLLVKPNSYKFTDDTFDHIMAIDEKPMVLYKMKAVMVELDRETELNMDRHSATTRIKWTTRNDMEGYFGYSKYFTMDGEERHETVRSSAYRVSGGTKLMYESKSQRGIYLDEVKFGKHEFIEKCYVQVMVRP